MARKKDERCSLIKIEACDRCKTPEGFRAEQPSDLSDGKKDEGRSSIKIDACDRCKTPEGFRAQEAVRFIGWQEG